MLQYINSFGFNSQIGRINYSRNNNLPPRLHANKLQGLQQDTVTFTGMSAPSHYKSVFDYLAADILSKNKKYQVDGSMLSATNIKGAIDKLFNLNRVYGPYITSNYEKIKWKSYIPQDIRIYSIDKINEARASRLKQWQQFLEQPESNPVAKAFPELIDAVKGNKSLKFVIWNAVNSEIKVNNRHIPVPLDPVALYKTIVGYEKIEPIDRAVRCASPSFIELYTHRLRDTLLETKGLSDNKAVWVRIPSFKNDPMEKEANVASLEILSNRNWCTRSSVDKAEAALEDGDFHLFLERDKNNLWKTQIGMTTSSGKIDQIQGPENNNIIPTSEVENIKEYLKSNGLKCQSGIIPEGPKALQQILISEKLAEFDETLGKTLEKAIKDDDAFAIFKFMNGKVKTLENGKLEIGTYKPSYVANANSGISVPYSMMGINEDVLLKDVEVINGDFILDNKNSLFNSSITEIPPSLKTVTGKIVCTKEQYQRFAAEIDKLTNGNSRKLIIHTYQIR